jgi:hypothetical protein
MSALCGFLTYDPNIGIDSIGPEFVHDLHLLASKLYRQYHLKITFEDYFSMALEQVLRALPIYDPTRRISTYIYRVIQQVAQDNCKAMWRESFESAEDVLGVNPQVSASLNISRDLDLDFRKGLKSLAITLYHQGVWLNQDRVYFDFLAGVQAPLVNAILWQYVLDISDETIDRTKLYGVIDQIALDLGLDPKSVLGLYSVIGSDLFFVLETLKGSRLSIPKTFTAAYHLRK